jgi:hypothetical protein
MKRIFRRYVYILSPPRKTDIRYGNEEGAIAMTSRREMLRMLAFNGMVPGAYLFRENNRIAAHNELTDFVTEAQRGDPDSVDEYVTFSPERIRQTVVKTGKATFEGWEGNVPHATVSVARRFLGRSRKADPAQIAEFLDLFGLPLKSEKSYVPFCAAGLSYCALLAYTEALNQQLGPAERLGHFRKLMPDLDHYYFYPTVSCIDMYHIAAGKRRWVDHRSEPSVIPKTGWIVLFDWNKRNSPDHCGLVQEANKEKLFTVEFNTSVENGSQRDGGTVAEKTRSYDYVVGFVVTDKKPL